MSDIVVFGVVKDRWGVGPVQRATIEVDDEPFLSTITVGVPDHVKLKAGQKVALSIIPVEEG